jgi:O-succinylbenzoate synthase
VAEPNFVLNADSTITVPDEIGLGVRIIPERLAAAQLRRLGLSDG